MNKKAAKKLRKLTRIQGSYKDMKREYNNIPWDKKNKAMKKIEKDRETYGGLV